MSANPSQTNVTSPVYQETTRSIVISVQPVYLEDQSEPGNSHYVWAYHIRIENKSTETVQLIGRYWNITDANGTVREVRGSGVVGEQPTIAPGESFEYTSGMPLVTPSGIIMGNYFMISETGEQFETTIPSFSLDCPHIHVSVH